MNVTIIGTGFVGVVSAAVYAKQGHQVTGLDIDQKKILSLEKGKVPFFEPDLEKLLISQQKENRLSFTNNYEVAVKDADLVIIAVGTPSKPSGAVDLTYVKQASESLAPYLKDQAIVAVKSTVPPGIFKELEPIISKKTKKKYYLAALPEFLKEGTAVSDTLNPDRIVIGATDDFVFETLEKFYQPYNAPIVKTNPQSAQMIKYTANAYLATRITFINQIANLCEHNGANIEDVIAGIGHDKRIGSHYWYPGLGYGGSCFPKDVKELAAYAKKVDDDSNLVVTIDELNEKRIPRFLQKYEKQVGSWQDKTIAILGLSFKPNTNDLRQAPALKVIPELLKKGANIKAYDPKAEWQPEKYQDQYEQVNTIDEAVAKADAIFVLIEWSEIIEFDFLSSKLDKKQYFFDTRNQFNPAKLEEAGYIYQGIAQNHS